VQETGKEKPTGIFRHVIRSQSKRESRREQLPHRSKNPKLRPKLSATGHTQRETPSTMTLSLSDKSGAASVILCRSIYANKVDPFDTLPVKDVGNTGSLFHHCEYGSSFCSWNGQT
jgi:hypothetical protein